MPFDKSFLRPLILLFVVGWVGVACAPASTSDPELDAWRDRAEAVTIVRDTWGIPHVYGATDADAVFGMIYAQAEDDFNRIEVNYLNALGRLAEAEGESELFRDLRMRLFIDPDELRQQYASSPEWLRSLMDAWADGLNYFLHENPDVRPRVLDRFEPWMALAFSEGSIGGDIERVSLRELQGFYGTTTAAAGAAADTPSLSRLAAVWPEVESRFPADPLAEPGGSNGFAIAPSNSATGNALLLINPHTSFYFRAELQMVSDEGLNAYGAVTWGQFFVYQGFNETAGWMHTSSGADAIDEYAYEVDEREDGVYYAYGDEERRMRESTVTLAFRDGAGRSERQFTVYHSHTGPIIRAQDGRWISVRLMNEPVKALTQSYSRTKARNYAEFKETMELHTNSSNNTVFADAEGNIAYFHANFVPIRDTRFDWNRPVDGNDPATDWQGLHSVDSTVGVLNPPNGWIQNTNNWPYSVAGDNSPRPEDFPPYMATFGENPRGVHALRVLGARSDFTVDSLVEAAYDSYLPAFEPLVPRLMQAHAAAPSSDPLKADLAEPIETLRSWDYRFAIDSVPTTLAIFWGDELMRATRDEARAAGVSIYDYMAQGATSQQHLEALAAARDRLVTDFGDWRTPWGEVNRFQRRTGDIVQPFDDDAPSIPVAFASGRWGSLASFGASRFGTRKLYGTGGNSFVAAVEFGDTVRARAITAGGQSGDPASPHFKDQAERYAAGDLRPVWFYRADVDANAERQYPPGQ